MLKPFLLALGLSCGIASATRVADISRLDAQREERLTGVGLVLGLDGTGDGGDFAPAVRSLAQLLGFFGITTVPLVLCTADNVAMVALSVVVPRNGVRSGDALDVHITSIGAARSLSGGRLFVSPLTGPLPGGGGIFALAEGPVILEDTNTPTVGRIERGCVMERDLPKQFVRDGQFSIVLDDAHASWTTASHIAKQINETESLDGREIAVAIDPKNVVVSIPPAELARPDLFISRVQRMPVPLVADEARVRINERLGTIVITGDVEISPVVISMRGLTITAAAPPADGVRGPADPFGNPNANTPDNLGGRVVTRNFVPLATGDSAVNERSRAKLQDLVAALDRLNVPAEDRISILKELHRTGKLHARLIIE
ncbi:MAG: flagellar basal body P-ring protein FlgI [Planctomycetota bacterium]